MFKKLLLSVVIVLLALFCLKHLNHASSRDAFIGDSITYQWHFPRVNYGIWGETSAKILGRTPGALQGHQYRKVFFLAGTNDVLLGIGPEATAKNVEAMGELAEQAGSQPVLATLPPIFIENGRLLPAVTATNDGIRKIAATHHWPLVDYYGALRDHPGELVGGVHMKRRSYMRMEIALLRTTNPF